MKNAGMDLNGEFIYQIYDLPIGRINRSLIPEHRFRATIASWQ